MKGIAALWPLTLVMLGLIAGCASGPGEGSQEEAVKACSQALPPCFAPGPIEQPFVARGNEPFLAGDRRARATGGGANGCGAGRIAL